MNKFKSIFSKINDPRSDINKLHNLEDILLIGIISVICAADSWKDMETYAKAKVDFLRSFLDLPNGTPSDDTFNRVFSSIDSEQFETCFIDWVSNLIDITAGEVIPIDGKTLRGAKSNGKKSPFHMVSAWASKNNMVLGQVKVSEKSNEITAIPKLLELITVKGCVVTIDAMGCQKAIAETIIKQEADYILAVKENQKQLHQDILDEFRFGKTIDSHTDEDLGHGRIETRKCSVINDFKFIEDQDKWTGLESIVKVESIREFKNSDKPTETATRYYISSVKTDAKALQKMIRLHWGIENKLHWVLDVAFSEDASRKRAGNAAQNFSILSKIALNLLRKDKQTKQGLKGKRLKAAYNNNYLIKILGIKV
ncbi:ISAs1 family transposase [Changchengzhania lutea]|uniref:ISAs1 family transposase n=1 Tax=Changchengzhania lutea TaxID=2049305 RepID=UPI00115E2570|nr:ISAs1 family transposase [Changchengzhania lutea]